MIVYPRDEDACADPWAKWERSKGRLSMPRQGEVCGRCYWSDCQTRRWPKSTGEEDQRRSSTARPRQICVGSTGEPAAEAGLAFRMRSMSSIVAADPDHRAHEGVRACERVEDLERLWIA